MVTVGTGHTAPSVSMDGKLDTLGRKCYLIDDETCESEEFVDAFDFHGAMLEKANSDLLSINHCNA